jgi:ATP-dependent RNA circularization protein (DNA/RNA ligase family)
MDAQRYLAPKETEEWAKDLGIKHVPVNGYFKLGDIASNTDQLVSRADGKGINGRKREGIVFKHVDGTFSFKAISNAYLLKHGE